MVAIPPGSTTTGRAATGRPFSFMTTRQNSNEAFYGVQNLHRGGSLTLAQWQTYEMLWHFGPLDSKAVNEKAVASYGAQAKPPWGRQLKGLAALGLVAAQGGQYDVTGAGALQAAASKPKKPSAKKFKKGIEGLELLFIKHESLDDGLATPEVQGVIDWLKGKL
jgi:hypothetical protein